VKEVDDTPLNESESDGSLGVVFYKLKVRILNLEARVVELEKEVALLLEQRVTVRPPEADDDPEWF